MSASVEQLYTIILLTKPGARAVVGSDQDCVRVRDHVARVSQIAF